MDKMGQIRTLLKQNQKIVRFASMSVGLESFDDEIVRKFHEDENRVMDYEYTIDHFRESFQNLMTGIETKFEVNAEKITMGIRKKNVVDALNTELEIGTEAIRCTSKRFLVDTDNLKITEKSLYLKGTVNGTECIIGGFGISGNVMTGNEHSTISSGTINTDRLELKNALAGLLELNPDPGVRKTIYFTSAFRNDNRSREESSTVFGYVNVKGDVNATYGWNGEIDEDGVLHGTDYNLAFGILRAKTVKLQTESGGYSIRNRLRCRIIYSESKDDEWSDARLKHDVRTISAEMAEKIIAGLRPRNYVLKKTGRRAYGYVAQELKEILDAEGVDGIVAADSGMLAVAYKELIPFRIRQIQINQERIERLMVKR